MQHQHAMETSFDLEAAIARRIFERTWGRIHRLEVQMIDDRVVVRGRTSTYYAKQLALEGVLDVIGTDGTSGVELEIDVGDCRQPHATARTSGPILAASPPFAAARESRARV